MTTQEKHRWIFAVLVSITFSAAVTAQSSGVSAWTFKGYVKNLQQWFFTADSGSLTSSGFFHNRLMLNWAPDSSAWTLDLAVRNRLFYGEGYRIQPGFASLLDADQGLVDLAFVPVERPGLIGSVFVDRCWAQWQQGRWSLRAGRQRINWGIATTWNPNDWFNAWNFLDFDYEERPGSDALRIQYQGKGFNQMEIALSPARAARRAVGAFRYSGHVGNFDWQALAGVYRNKLAVGTGWAGDLGKAGVKAEVSFFQPIDSSAGVAAVSASAEVNLVFKGSWFVSAGVLINSNGYGSSVNLFQLYQTNLAADNLMPGKVSALAAVSTSVTPLMQASFSALYSPNGQLIALLPSYAWSVSANWDIDLTGQLFWLKIAGGTVKNAGNGIYLRTRWSF